MELVERGVRRAARPIAGGLRARRRGRRAVRPARGRRCRGRGHGGGNPGTDGARVTDREDGRVQDRGHRQVLPLRPCAERHVLRPLGGEGRVGRRRCAEERGEIARDLDGLAVRVEHRAREDDRVRVAGDEHLSLRGPERHPVIADVRVAIGGRHPAEGLVDGGLRAGDVDEAHSPRRLEGVVEVHRGAEAEEHGGVRAEPVDGGLEVRDVPRHHVEPEHRGPRRRVPRERDLPAAHPDVVGEGQAVEVAVVRPARHVEVRLRRARVVDARLARPRGKAVRWRAGRQRLARAARAIEASVAIGARPAGGADVARPLRLALAPEPDESAPQPVGAVRVRLAGRAARPGAAGDACLGRSAVRPDGALVVDDAPRAARAALARLAAPAVAGEPGPAIARCRARTADAGALRAVDAPLRVRGAAVVLATWCRADQESQGGDADERTRERAFHGATSQAKG